MQSLIFWQVWGNQHAHNSLETPAYQSSTLTLWYTTFTVRVEQQSAHFDLDSEMTFSMSKVGSIDQPWGGTCSTNQRQWLTWRVSYTH